MSKEVKLTTPNGDNTISDIASLSSVVLIFVPCVLNYGAFTRNKTIDVLVD